MWTLQWTRSWLAQSVRRPGRSWVDRDEAFGEGRMKCYITGEGDKTILKAKIYAISSDQCCPGNTGAVFPGKYRPVQYPLSGKYREILGNINNLLVFCVTRIYLKFKGVFKSKISYHTSHIHYVLVNQA